MRVWVVFCAVFMVLLLLNLGFLITVLLTVGPIWPALMFAANGVLAGALAYDCWRDRVL